MGGVDVTHGHHGGCKGRLWSGRWEAKDTQHWGQGQPLRLSRADISPQRQPPQEVPLPHSRSRTPSSLEVQGPPEGEGEAEAEHRGEGPQRARGSRASWRKRRGLDPELRPWWLKERQEPASALQPHCLPLDPAPSQQPTASHSGHTFGSHGLMQQAAVLLGRQAGRQAANKQGDVRGYIPALCHVEPRLAHLPHGHLQGEGRGCWAGENGTTAPGPLSPHPRNSKTGHQEHSQELSQHENEERGHRGFLAVDNPCLLPSRISGRSAVQDLPAGTK